MGLGDKIKHAAEKVGGKGKEAAGKATGDESLKAEGKTELPRGFRTAELVDSSTLPRLAVDNHSGLR